RRRRRLDRQWAQHSSNLTVQPGLHRSPGLESAIIGDPLGITKSWAGPNVCSYKGVFCTDTFDFMGNPTGKAVTAVDLNHANLQGTLVKELALLTDLSLFHVNTNRLNGTVPSSFKQLSSLAELDLSNNRFSVPFPSAALYIPNLVYLDLIQLLLGPNLGQAIRPEIRCNLSQQQQFQQPTSREFRKFTGISGQFSQQ
ncbi:leucine-rich repeat extensin-like protein 4, partial [Phtheirospermum japonicum]